MFDQENKTGLVIYGVGLLDKMLINSIYGW